MNQPKNNEAIDKYKCQSYYDNDNILCDCTCGKCEATPSLSEGEEMIAFVEIDDVGVSLFKNADRFKLTVSGSKEFVKEMSLSQTRKEERERMVAIGDALLEELHSRYRGGEGDMPDVFYEGEEEAITTYPQKIKSLE